MSTKHQEIVANQAELEAPDNNKSLRKSSTGPAKEVSPKNDAANETQKLCDSRLLPTVKNTPNRPKTPKISPKLKPKVVRNRSVTRTLVPKKESSTSTQPKSAQSGIPLRMKSSSNTAPVTPKTASGKTYRHQNQGHNLPTINKNTLEVQFMNNKKRLLLLHAELVEKQRPLLDIHKSLLRTKKQLEELGRKVVLEDIKIISLKEDEPQIDMGAGETMIPDEAAAELKSAIENVIGGCVEACQKCFLKSGDVVKMLEGVSKAEIELTDVEVEVEDLKKQKLELEEVLEKTVKENEDKIEELMNLWKKALTSRNGSAELNNKVIELEEKLNRQQKIISEADENVISLNRKFEEKKFNYEKQAAELQEKIIKLEDDLKKEKKNANDNLMKSRNLRGKVIDLENKAKEADDRAQDANTKLKQVQEQMKRKEIQWLKEKEEFKKNEALLQQKFTEKQSHFDTRMKDLEEQQNTSQMQQENFFRTMDTQLAIKEQELLMMERERNVLGDRSHAMEEQIAILSKHIEDRDKEIEQLNMKQKESIPALEYRDESQWEEIIEYKKQIAEVQDNLKQQNDQITKMQSSLKAHAQLAVALKLEKDNAIKYSTKLRDILQEARDEIEYKNKTIYKIHEKLVLKEAACEKLQNELKDLETLSEYSGMPRKSHNRCQICMSTIGEKTECSFAEGTEVSNSSTNNNSRLSATGQYVSKSLIGMSVRKVDNLRARLDNLKKMTMPGNNQQVFQKLNSWSAHSCPGNNNNKGSDLKKQIAMRGKLYTILQKHADQSCEDFINLLKLTASSSGKNSQAALGELKPSNMNVKFDERVSYGPVGNMKVTNSFSAFSKMFSEGGSSIDETTVYDEFEESVVVGDEDDYNY